MCRNISTIIKVLMWLCNSMWLLFLSKYTPKLLDHWPKWIGQLFLHFVELSLKKNIAKIENGAFSRTHSRPICKMQNQQKKSFLT